MVKICLQGEQQWENRRQRFKGRYAGSFRRDCEDDQKEISYSIKYLRVVCDVRTEESHDSLSDQNSCLQRALDQDEWDEYQ